MEIGTKQGGGDKIIEAGGVLRRVGEMLLYVMGGIAGEEGNVERMEEVMSLCNFLTSI